MTPCFYSGDCGLSYYGDLGFLITGIGIVVVMFTVGIITWLKTRKRQNPKGVEQE